MSGRAPFVATGGEGFLSTLVEELQHDLAQRPPDEAALMARVRDLPPPRDFEAALRAGSPGLIAEVKRSSPSAGQIAKADAAAQARAYQAAGASAVSVLTIARHFGGSLEDLGAVAAAVGIPVLRKDFLIHPAQLVEARANGADAVLLIAACLTLEGLRAMLATTTSLGLAALVETHTGADLDKALEAGADIIGVNARDLESLDVDAERALALLRRVPIDRLRVMESGIATREQVLAATEAGADAVLVGEALMRAADPGVKLRELLGKD